jgi:hypothetical protein
MIYIIINFRDELKKEIKKEEIEFTVDPIVINDSKIIEDLNIININISQNETEEIENRKKKEKEDIERYNKLLDMPKNPEDPLIKKERETILENYYRDTNKTDMIIYFDMAFPFGNQIAAVNKMIFYCEIIHCKKLILPVENRIYIKHTLLDKEYNLQIEVGMPEFFGVDFIGDISPEFFYDFYNLKIENRISIFKNEIINNLPKVNVSQNDLIIHVRSGDIFQHKGETDYAPDYSQPPLCFYQKILEQFKFSDIYIIAEDNIFNPVIKELKKKYPKIKYNQNSLEIDISYLIYGYNIVGSISSFLISSIKLNDNIKFLWEYDRYPMCSKIFHFHHSIFNIPRNYTIYQMPPSETYKNKMIVWKCSDEQINIMLNDKCPYNFKIIEPNN